jgi:chaperonin GroES
MKELQPVNQQVILDITENVTEKKTASGLIIPGTAAEKPNEAPVVWTGLIEKPEIKPGDIVLYKPFSGTEVEFGTKKYLILPYADVLAKVVETEMI